MVTITSLDSALVKRQVLKAGFTPYDIERVTGEIVREASSSGFNSTASLQTFLAGQYLKNSELIDSETSHTLASNIIAETEGRALGGNVVNEYFLEHKVKSLLPDLDKLFKNKFPEAARTFESYRESGYSLTLGIQSLVCGGLTATSFKFFISSLLSIPGEPFVSIISNELFKDPECRKETISALEKKDPLLLIALAEKSKRLKPIREAFDYLHNLKFGIRDKFDEKAVLFLARLLSLGPSKGFNLPLPFYLDTHCIEASKKPYLDMFSGTNINSFMPLIGNQRARSFVFLDNSKAIELYSKELFNLFNIPEEKGRFVLGDAKNVRGLFEPESFGHIRLHNAGDYFHPENDGWYRDVSNLVAPGGRILVGIASVSNGTPVTLSDIIKDKAADKENSPIVRGFLKETIPQGWNIKYGHEDSRGIFHNRELSPKRNAVMRSFDSLVVFTKPYN